MMQLNVFYYTLTTTVTIDLMKIHKKYNIYDTIYKDILCTFYCLHIDC